mgnify:CR=1 FL=1
MNLETKITIYKFTPQLFTLTRNNLKNQISYGKENFVFTYMRWAMLVFLY